MTRVLGVQVQGRKVDLLLLSLLVLLLYHLHHQQQRTKAQFVVTNDIAKSIHLYPQNKQPINDVYGNISKDIQTNWTCSGCNWMTCSNSKDRLLFDEYIVKCFQRWSDVANELSLLSVPIYGGLIASYHRNATIMKWEYDLDVWVWAHDVATLIDYQETYNNNHQYTGNVSSTTYPYESWIEIQEDWKTKYKEAEHQRAARFHYELPVTLEGDVHSAYVDIVPIYPDACDPREQGMDHCRQLVESGNYTSIQFFTKKYQLMEIPKSELFPLESCYLNGVHTSCPAKPVEILNHLYHGIDVAAPDHYLNQTTGCWTKKD